MVKEAHQRQQIDCRPSRFMYVLKRDLPRQEDRVLRFPIPPKFLHIDIEKTVPRLVALLQLLQVLLDRASRCSLPYVSRPLCDKLASGMYSSALTSFCNTIASLACPIFLFASDNASLCSIGCKTKVFCSSTSSDATARLLVVITIDPCAQMGR